MKATRKQIEGQVKTLAVAFPSGVNNDQMTLYTDDIEAINPELEDLQEAMLRVRHVRDARTFPPFAEIRAALLAAENDREGVDLRKRENLETRPQEPRRLSPAEQEIVHHIHTLGRKHGVYWCARERRFLRPGEPHRCFPDKETAIPSLTQCYDMLERAWREGWKRGKSSFGNIAEPIERELSFEEELAKMGVEEPF